MKEDCGVSDLFNKHPYAVTVCTMHRNPEMAGNMLTLWISEILGNRLQNLPAYNAMYAKPDYGLAKVVFNEAGKGSAPKYSIEPERNLLWLGKNLTGIEGWHVRLRLPWGEAWWVPLPSPAQIERMDIAYRPQTYEVLRLREQARYAYARLRPDALLQPPTEPDKDAMVRLSLARAARTIGDIRATTDVTMKGSQTAMQSE